MRIACVHLPGVAIQAAVRLAPGMAGRPVGLIEIGPSGVHPRLAAVSRLAYAAGARVGMTVLEARASCPDLVVQAEDPVAVSGLFAGLADAVAELAQARVQIDPARGVLCELPAGARGASFGERLHEIAAQLGLVSRVGVADDVFTAWAATQAVPRTAVRCVPAGGAAAFLAPLPLELLPLDSEVLHTLEVLGIKRLGAFAQLPAPSVGRKWSAGTLDLQSLARGDGPARLVPTPRGAVSEAMTLDPPATDPEALGFLLLPLAERVCVRLAGRQRSAQTMRLSVAAAQPAHELTIDVTIEAGSAHARTWLDLFRSRLGQQKGGTLAHPALRLQLEVLREVAPAQVALDLFARAAARVNAAPQGLVSAATTPRRTRRAVSAAERPAPGLFDRASQAPAMNLRVLPLPTPEPGSMRVVEPPQPLASQGELPSGAPEKVVIGGTQGEGEVAHKVTHALGPTRLEAPWAQGQRVSRDYWELTLDDGRRLWVFRDRVAGGLYLSGVLS